MTKRVYLFDGLSEHNTLTTNFNGFWDCQESPLEAGVFLIPEASTDIQPPTFDGAVDTCHWDGTQWILTPIPKPVTPATPVAQTGQTSANQPTTSGTTTL